MRRGHRGGRRGFGRGHGQPWRRFGGFNPLKALAVVAGVAVGGIVAAGLAGLVLLLLTVIGIATASVSWAVTYWWIIAAYLIYRAVRAHQKREDYSYDYDDDDFEWDDDAREREYQRRAEQLRQSATTPRPDTRPKQPERHGVGTAAIAILAGLGLALGANLGLSGLQLPPLANTLLPPVIGAGAGLGVYAALKRWVMPPVDDGTPPGREVRAQIKRIRRKARDLSREATEAGGVFRSLDSQADRLAGEASSLAERLFELRDVARDVRREFGDPTQPEVRAALHEAQQAQKRLDELLARNRSAQHRILAQIERIEDLLDVARLEVACPEEATPAERRPERLVQEVETELEASRRALAEVRRHSEMV